jgi:isopentenyldiphosphate isomerase
MPKPRTAGDATSADREDELLDLVDEGNRPVGVVRRGDCHGNPALAHRAVHVFVKNGRGEYFLQKRSGRKRIQPGRWDTSVGGHVLAGETYENAAVTELHEELGIRLADPGELCRSHDYVWRSPVETEHVRTFILVREGPFMLQADEIDDGRFWSEDQMRAALGTGHLTPNLEAEMCHLGLAR